MIRKVEGAAMANELSANRTHQQEEHPSRRFSSMVLMIGDSRLDLPLCIAASLACISYSIAPFVVAVCHAADHSAQPSKPPTGSNFHYTPWCRSLTDNRFSGDVRREGVNFGPRSHSDDSGIMALIAPNGVPSIG
jgi:hypothetical protein